MWTINKKEDKKENEEFSEEEIQHYERMLISERAKCERLIEKQKEKIENLTPKSFIDKMKGNKKELEKEEEILNELEERLIDLKAMNGRDLLLEVKAREKKSKFTINDKTADKLADVISAAGKYVPLPGASAVTGLLGELIKPGKKK